MSYEEALLKANGVEWQTKECGTPDCWCLIIEPKEPIFYEHDGFKEQLFICSSGALDKITADHIVKVHNENL